MSTPLSRPHRRTLAIAAVPLAALAVAACGGSDESGEAADNYPEKAIQMVVPWSAGGDTDAVFRIVAEGLSEELGQDVVIQNVAGGGGSIGAQQALTAEPDGYTILAGHDSIAVSEITGQTDFGYEDFEPVALLTSTYDFVATNPSNDWEDLTDVVAQLEEDPQSVSFGASIGSTSHLTPLLIGKEGGVEFNIVGYTDTAERMQAVVGGHVDLGVVSVIAGKEYMDADQMKLLAYLGPERSEEIPDIPTAEELGINVSTATNRGIFLPKDAPPEVVEKLSEALGAVMESGDVADRLLDLGTDVNYLDHEEYAEWLTENEDELRTVMEEAGLTG